MMEFIDAVKKSGIMGVVVILVKQTPLLMKNKSKQQSG